MSNHSGVFEHSHDENLGEFLNKHASNVMQSKAMLKMKPTVTINAGEEESYSLQMKVPGKTFNWEFKLGEEVRLETPEGKKNFIFSLDGNNLVQTPVGDDASGGMKVIREFTDDGMKMILLDEASGDTANRIFTRQ